MPNNKTQKKPNFSKEEKIYFLDASKISVSTNRQRQIFKPKEMAELVNSIKDLGQLQPGICRRNGKKIELVFGERRLRACEEIGIPFQFIFKEDIKDPFLLERMELEENLIREDLDWKEEVRAKKRIFDILKASDPQQTVETVGNYLGVGKGTLSEDISLAIWIEENEEVAGAPNKTTAKKITKRLFVTVKKDEALEESIGLARAKTIKLLKNDPTSDSNEELEEALSFEESKVLFYDSQCILGKMEEKLLDFPDNYFDIAFFDPPWGVNYDQSQKDAESQKKYLDCERDFFETFYKRIKLLYNKLSENSHLYVFFGIVHYKFVYSILEKAGFKVSKIPLIWHKIGSCRTRAPEWEYGRSYEPIAFARKGVKRLNLPPSGNVISTPQPTASMKDIHPSAKHPEIYRKLLIQSSYPGDKVLDPMAGSGMFAVAAEDLRERFNLNWTQIEIDKSYRNLQIFNLSKGYDYFIQQKDLNPSSEPSPEERAQAWANSHPKVEISEDFKTLQIGSEDWKNFWSAHPEKQEEMLKWRTQYKGKEV